MAHYFNIRNPFSADYLQHWGNTPKDLLAELDTVRRTAAYIIERIEKGREGGVAGQTSECERHHPRPRSQGGKETFYLCANCNAAHHCT